jgi:hypothetical protein
VGIGIWLWGRDGDTHYDRWVAVLATAIGAMQFVELVMWLDQSCTGWNEGASVFAFILLTWIHPSISLYQAYYYWYRITHPVNYKHRAFDVWVLLTLAWSVTRTAVYPPSSAYICTVMGDKHLDWDWDRHLLPSGSYVTLYYVFTFVPLLAQGITRGVFWLTWSAGVAIIASWVGDGTGDGSMYCWLGACSGIWQLLGVPRWLNEQIGAKQSVPYIHV